MYNGEILNFHYHVGNVEKHGKAQVQGYLALYRLRDDNIHYYNLDHSCNKCCNLIG